MTYTEDDGDWYRLNFMNNTEICWTHSPISQYCKFCRARYDVVAKFGKHYEDCPYYHFVILHQALNTKCLNHTEWENEFR